MTLSDRDARIAAIGLRVAAHLYAVDDVLWLIAELRASLSREAAWKAAHDRLFCGAVSLSENG